MTDYLKLHKEYIEKGVFSKLILDSAFEAVFTKSPEGIITSWSKGAEKIYGYAEQEIVGKPISVLAPPDKQAEMLDILKKNNRGEKLDYLETHRLSKEGSLIDVVISAVPIIDNGKVIGSAVFQRDVSVQKEAERNYYQLFEHASDAIFIADINGKYTNVNSAACKMLGYNKSELIGKTILDLIPPEDEERLWRSKEQLLQPGEVQIAEWTLKKKDGTYLPVEVSAKILEDGRWQGFVRDISQQKEAERKFTFIFESAPDAQLIVTEEGVIQAVNQNCERMFGYTKSELIGNSIEMLVPADTKKAHAESRKNFFTALDRRRMGRVNIRGRKKDGSELPVDVMLSSIDLDGENIILACVRDLSPLKELSAYARNLIEASQDPFIVTDLEGIITDANKAALELLGYTVIPAGVHITEHFLNPEKLRVSIGDVLKQERIKEIPVSAKDRNGEFIDFLVSASVYKDYFGNKDGVFYVLKDVSELIRVASRLIAAESYSKAKPNGKKKTNTSLAKTGRNHKS